ncbi:competence protein CoiA [Chitinophaga pinensis]|uniref:Competence protein n=1 Tax=Chitinophaga pinensis (strain ATCC 43595 / DSM 2588 / LMG 13176 / NBRC 15968 / NCIMB 11800 / UQM 2034) TaxID=485918 RepID=A0A979G4F3_CHIPD|nr:competence protein CoiA family protein [Chitinophaga pinensis]ACU60491.1 putative competence protein [Chitinophaga pinensis DSM 2588]
MRFALVDGQLIEALYALEGTCPGCGKQVFARCGDVRVAHWAHAGEKMCDRWWDSETEWHRSWKSQFPQPWQEVFRQDVRTHEIHIADVQTEHDLVIEFQHSSIKKKERDARESIYGNMVWVVDGAFRKNDYSRFFKNQGKFKFTEESGIFHVDRPEECFHSTWLSSSKPVIFDFRAVAPEGNIFDAHKYLYCLFPISIGGSAVFAELTPDDFIKKVIKGEWLLWFEGLMNGFR